jgi:hypothetical protein
MAVSPPVLLLESLSLFSQAQDRKAPKSVTASSPRATCASSSSRRTSTARSRRASCCVTSAVCSCPRRASPVSTSSCANRRPTRCCGLLGKGWNVSDKPNSPTYAPAAFADEPDAKTQGLRKPDFKAAMSRLFSAGKIHVGTHGRPSRPYSKLAVVKAG